MVQIDVILDRIHKGNHLIILPCMVYGTYEIFRFGRGEYPVNPEKHKLVAAGNSRFSLSLSLPDLFD